MLIILVLLIFCIVLLVFYIPGDFFLRKYNLSGFIHFTLCTMLGLVLWSWQEWVFGWIHIRFASYIYIIIFLTLWIVHKRWKIISFQKIKLDRHKIILVLVIILGCISMLPGNFFAVFPVNNGYISYNPMLPDQLWHIALISQIIKDIPPIQPGMAENAVTNYHYFGDMAIAGLIRVFKLPFFLTTFQVFSIFLALFFGLTAIAFSKLLKLSFWYQLFLLIFLYFGGDFIPFLLLLLGKGFIFSWEAMEQSSWFLVNYPRAFATNVYFFTLCLLVLWIKYKNSKTLLLLLSLSIASLFGFKANVGLASLIGIISILVIYSFTKKWVYVVWIGIIGLLTAIVYLPVNKGAGGLVYTGFWRVEDFGVNPHLGLQRLELARRIFKEDNKHFKALFFDLIFFFLFVIGTFGTRLVAFFQTKHSLKKFPWEVHVYLLTGLLISFILGMFFIQKSGGANSFNFLSTIFITSSFYAALSLVLIKKLLPKFISIPLITIIIILTIARPVQESLDSYYGIYKIKSQNFLPISELSFYDFINYNTSKDDLFLNGNYLFTHFTGRNNYLGASLEQSILDSHGVKIETQKQNKSIILESTDFDRVAYSLQESKIDYVIGTPAIASQSALFKKIYNQSGNTLYRVNKELVNTNL